MHQHSINALLASAAALVLSTTAHAATISWSTAPDIAGDSDVKTNGTLVAAYRFGDANVTSKAVNGVTFQPFAIGGGANSYTTGGYTFSNNTTPENFGSAATHTWQSLSANYTSLLTSAVELVADRGYQLTLTGLVSGQTYQFQAWLNDSTRALTQFHFHGSVGDGNGDNVDYYLGDLGSANTGIPATPGEYVIGTFTASALTQNVTFSHSELSGELNGFQLRLLRAPIPEPGTALFGLALVGATLTRRGPRALRP